MKYLMSIVLMVFLTFHGIRLHASETKEYSFTIRIMPPVGLLSFGLSNSPNGLIEALPTELGFEFYLDERLSLEPTLSVYNFFADYNTSIYSRNIIKDDNIFFAGGLRVNYFINFIKLENVSTLFYISPTMKNAIAVLTRDNDKVDGYLFGSYFGIQAKQESFVMRAGLGGFYSYLPDNKVISTGDPRALNDITDNFFLQLDVSLGYMF